MGTIICRSVQSFIDLCDNELVSGQNVHCTFSVLIKDRAWMKDYLETKKGGTLSFTPFLQEESPRYSNCL
ncbi:TPA: hypothetical protein I7724_19735 [Vibrio vulnificus]|nr:hypothetical protein [Vibrio vulnificus]